MPEYILYLRIRLVKKKSFLEANTNNKCYVKYVFLIYSIDITLVQQMYQLAVLCIEILAKVFLTPFNLNPHYSMPHQTMGPLPQLGQSGYSPQQEMGGLMGGMLVLTHLCA